MFDFKPYPSYRRTGNIIGVLTGIFLLSSAFYLVFFKKSLLFGFIKENIFLILTIISLSLAVYFLLSKSILQSIKLERKWQVFTQGIQGGFYTPGQNLGKAVNFLLLLFVYLFGVGSVSIVSKLTKRSFLKLKVDKRKKTYWEKTDLGKSRKDSYYRQY